MKYCNGCKLEHPISYFAKKGKGLQPRCKLFTREASKLNYTNNKKAYIAKNKRRALQATTVLRKLKNIPCVDCGILYPYYVMDFDHTSGKKLEVSKLVSYGVDVVVKEAAKCDVVCSNCHRERTHQRKHAIMV